MGAIGRWLAFVVMSLVARPTAAATFEVTSEFDEASLGRSLEIAYDETGARSVDDVLTDGALAWRKSEADVPNLGFRRGALWARVRIVDRRSTPEPLVVAFPYPPLDAVTLCEVRDGVPSCRRAGDHVPRGEWPRPTFYAAFDLEAAREHVLVARVQDASLQMPIELRSRAEHAHAERVDLASRAGYYALALGLLLYNALLWAVTGTRLYGYYIAYTFFFVVQQWSADGTAYATLLADRGVVCDRMLAAAILASAALAAFAEKLLFAGTTGRRGQRVLERTARWIPLGLVLVPAPWPWPMVPLAVCAGVALTATGVVAVGEAWRGSRSARLFLVAFAALLLAVLHAVLTVAGVVPEIVPPTTELMIGSALELVLFAFALADRMKALEAQAREHAEDSARHALASEANAERARLEQVRANEELQRLDRLKDEFLANTSHELRTPLHGILGLSEAVLEAEEGLSEAGRERLALIVASGRRLGTLVNDILDFSKLRHAEVLLRTKSIDLHAACVLALSMVAPLAEAKALTLRLEVPEGLRVSADENRLQQILANLLGNAVKFTESGTVTLRARAEGEGVRIEVEDTGIGIAPDALERIFESFEQGDGSVRRRFGGTGLGLAVTRKLVELHGSAVTVRSVLGAGSVFAFTLRSSDANEARASLTLERAAHRGSLLLQAARVGEGSAALDDMPSAAELAAIGARRMSSRPPERRGHLLVADDDPVNLEVLRAQLEPAGYKVTLVRDGEEALSAAASGAEFDGVLLDVMMPRMSGPEAATALRSAHPHGTLPILMLTAKSRPEDAIAGLRAGASDYLGKPFHREELLQRLESHVLAVRTARAFRRFVPADFLALLGVERFEELESGIGQRHELTVLFADVRNFTMRSEQLGPEGTFRFVNECLRRFAPVVRDHGGFVDKFIGDAIMAIFPGDPRAAMRAAAGLFEEVAQFNASLAAPSSPLAIGIGAHRGPVILGTVGGTDRIEVTAIGDAVNVAARLEALSKSLGAGAIVSEEVVGVADDQTRRVGAVRVRGRAEPVELFEVLRCCASDEERTQKAATAERFQRGLRAYAQGDVARAREHFAACVDEAPSDHVAALYLTRCTAYLERGLPEGFDGTLDAK